MPFTDNFQQDAESIGAGQHGILKIKGATLAAGVSEEVKFGKFKLLAANLENAVVVFDQQTTGAGTPDTTVDILADGEGITLEDAAGGNYCFAIMGVWTLK